MFQDKGFFTKDFSHQRETNVYVFLFKFRYHRVYGHPYKKETWLRLIGVCIKEIEMVKLF